MKELPFSIITVCFNEAARIALTCESVVNQTFQEFDWIVLDGGSTDGTRDILKQYAHRMNSFVSEPDRGIYHAMNKGIAQARGTYLLFLNGGDYLYQPDVLASVSTSLTSRAKDLYYGDIFFERRDHWKRVSIELTNPYELFIRRTLPHQAMFIKRELFERYGYYDESFPIAADLDFLLRVFVSSSSRKEHTIEHLPVLISVYDSMHGASARDLPTTRTEKNNLRRKHYPVLYFLYRQWTPRIFQYWQRRLNLIKRGLKK